ncbi:TetR/AcrR family transcriptional regulator [Cellulomonas sp. URHB0016]
MVKSEPARRGRRRGPSTTRDAILAAARRQFADLGYDRATVRGIAAEAGCDPKLVGHWFGSKQELFLQVVELPIRPAVALADLRSTGDPATLPDRLAAFVVAQMETDAVRSRMVPLIRAAATEPAAAPLLRDLLVREVLAPVAAQLGGDTPELRASLLASQLLGLMMARYVIAVEPLASASPETVAAAIAPVLRHYLDDRLG